MPSDHLLADQINDIITDSTYETVTSNLPRALKLLKQIKDPVLRNTVASGFDMLYRLEDGKKILEKPVNT